MQELEPQRNKSKMISSQILHTCTDLRLPPHFFEVNVLVVEPPQRLWCPRVGWNSKENFFGGQRNTNHHQIITIIIIIIFFYNTTAKKGTFTNRPLEVSAPLELLASTVLNLEHFPSHPSLHLSDQVEVCEGNIWKQLWNLRKSSEVRWQKRSRKFENIEICVEFAKVLSLRTRMWCTGLGTHAQVHVR